MSGEVMVGKCDICGKENVELERKYYYYNIKCECHSPQHFEIVDHCKACIPKPPKKTTIYIEPINK